MDARIVQMARGLLGAPDSMPAHEVAQRLRVEMIRFEMQTGLFKDRPALLTAYLADDAAAFAAAAGIELPTTPPSEPATLETINAKLDLVLSKLSGG